MSSPIQIHICIPSFDMVCADFMMSVTNLVMYMFQNKISDEPLTLKIINKRGSLIADSRESLVEKSLLEGATHILFLDSDMNFPEDALHRLFFRNKPLVAANYVKRCLPTTPTAVTLLGNPLYTNDDSTGIDEVASAGFGVCLIRAEVFDAMPRPWFDTYWYTNEAGKRLIIGEDVYFCKKAKHAGYTTYVDQDVSKEVTHIGTMEYIHAMAKIE